MDLLLDTHVLLWWDDGAGQLSPATRTLIADSANHVHVSAASIWEIAVKSAKGKLRFSGHPALAITKNGFLPVAISPAHAEAAGWLDWSHPDPFDRMLVSQARAEGLTLIHADSVVRAYTGVAQFWAR